MGQGTDPLGATINKSGTNVTGVTFRVWAPNATGVAVRGQFNNWGETVMTKDDTTGYWAVTVPAARPGQEYQYFLRWDGNANGTWKQDPRAVWVRRDGGGKLNSVIYDHSSFDWGGVNRPSIPVNRQVMYELHLGSFYDSNPRNNLPATFDDAIVRLDYLQRLGVNVIALMPVNEFGGDYSWGYNPHYPYAIEDAYGGPDGLKRFIKAAHQRGMKVQIDVVHNHWLEAGVKPEDSVWQFDGPANAYFFPDPVKQWTPWGPRPDYDKPEVRRYIQDNIKLLLDAFRVDGFRWDSPQNILGYDTTQSGANPDIVLTNGKSMMTAVNRMIHEQYPDRWSIAEDANLLTPRTENWSYPTGSFFDLLRVDQVADSFDGHWQTSFHNEITPEIASASPNVEKIRDKVSGWSEPPGYRVIFTDNHDKSGSLNNATRLANRMDPLDPEGKTARRKTLLNAVLTLTAPGTPMLWMGQEFHATGPFTDSVPLDWRRAFAQHRIFRAHRDLVELRETLPALQNSDLADAPGGIDEANDIYVYWRRNPGVPADDLVIFMNFSGQDRSNVNVSFPSSGIWHVRMNTDWRVYGDDFGNFGPGGSISVNNGSVPLGIAAHSAIIFARTAPPAGFSLDDADLDGLADGWESMTGVSDPSADDDSDGLPNLFEYQSGLDPVAKDVATVTYHGMTHVMRASSNNPVVQHIAWAVDPVSVIRSSEFTFVSNSVPGPFFTNPAGSYLRFSLNLTNSSSSYSFFSPNTDLAVVDTNRTNWAVFHGVTNFNANPDNDAFTNLQEFARGSDPNVTNRALVCLAGQFNSWNASANPMSFAGDNLWILDLPFRSGTTSEFKFTSTAGTTTTWWGDIQADGVADDDASAPNISINFSQGKGIYRFRFNEASNAYQVTYDATDANADGIQDAWVAYYGLSGANGFATADPDGDGWSNLAEFSRFTNANGTLMNPALSDSVASPKRMTVTGNTGPLPIWQPNARNMTWSDRRMQWEWAGTFTSTTNIQFKFSQATNDSNWSGGDSWGWSAGNSNSGVAIRSGGNNIIAAVTNGVRYRFAFHDLAGTYSISSYPVSAEWWETNGLPAPLPATNTDPRWDEDADGDGFTHRVEYALGGSPLAANSSGLFSSWQTNVGGTNRLVLQWLHRTNGTPSLGIAAVASGSLSGAATNWTTNGVTVTPNVSQLNVPAGFQRREASVPMDGAAKFLRLRVTGP